MQKMKKLFLKQLPLFAHLDEANLSSIADSIEKFVLRKNELVFQEGQMANYLFMVFDGQVKIFKSTPDGKEHILHVMPKYSIIAEVPMFEGGVYPANGMAIKDSILFAMPRKKLISLVKHDPQIALNMLALQAKRLREFTDKIEQLSLKTIEQKFINFLLSNVKIEHGMRIVKINNIQELANYLGTARESLSRIINGLIKNKTISKVQGGFLVNHLDGDFFCN